MKKIKNEDFANALTAIEHHLLNTHKIMSKEYDGYISSFGASVINSGLLPTLSFYTDIHKNSSEVRRYKLLKVLFKVLNPETQNNSDTGLLDHVLAKIYGTGYRKDARGPLPPIKHEELAKMKKRLLEVAVAVKLAMRNFKHSDSIDKSNQA